MSRKMPVRPEWLRPTFTAGGPVGVDRKAKVLRGYVVAQQGYFKDGRGQFTEDSLARILDLMQRAEPAGLKSRFTHPGMSDDGLGTFLGRAHAPRIDAGKVRADLHFDPTAFASPTKGDMATYVMDLAESDPDAFSSSLVLRSEKVYQVDDKGNPKVDEQGEEVPPVWLPTKLYASDIVDTGAAVDGVLSVEGLPLAELWFGFELLDAVFDGQSEAVVRARCQGYLERYLALKFPRAATGPSPDMLRRRLKLREMAARMA